MGRQRVGQMVGEAARIASTRRAERDLPALPPITPHSLRRTYISLALVANDFDVKWVMSQVGHADSKMTLDVYAQLGQRIPRHHWENLDRLLRDETLANPPGFASADRAPAAKAPYRLPT